MSTSSQFELSSSTFVDNNNNATICMAQETYPTTSIINNNKVVIFDWDDTLFPTSEFYRKLFGNDFDGKTMTILSQKILAIMKKCCLLYGPQNPFIVTNGSKGWIKDSLKKIMRYCWINNIENSFAEILNLISRNCINTLSAKFLYSQQFPKQTMLWKYYTFNAIINFTNADTLISIGDSNDEYLASKNVQKHNQIKLLHRIKLTAKPKMSEMNKQFDLILKLLNILPNYNEEEVDINYQEIKQKMESKKNKDCNN